MPYGSDPFSSPGIWLKGNLHTHSSRSDGDLAPDEVVNWYADRGYDFLAITDHRTRTIVDPPEGDRLTLIPSMEFDLWEEVTGFEFHVLGIGIKSIDESLRGESLRQTVAEIKSDGGLAILAHPHWHGLTTDVVLNCDGLDGMEVFNATTEDMNGKGESGYLWDSLLDGGMDLLGVAVDDAHWRGDDSGKAWIMAKAIDGGPEAILEAIGKGSFYSTQGPEIHDFTVTRDGAQARSSPVSEIRFISQRSLGRRVRSDGDLMETADYSFRGREKYVRLVCIDKDGKMAWSNPIARPNAEGAAEVQ